MPRQDASPDSVIQETNEKHTRRITHIVIPIEIWESDLHMSAKILLAEIYSLSNPICRASNAYLAKFIQVTPMRISQLVSELKKAKLIEEIGPTNPFYSNRQRGLVLTEKAISGYIQIYRGGISKYIPYIDSLGSKESKKTINNTGDAEGVASSQRKNVARERALSRKQMPDPAVHRTVENFRRLCKDKLGFEPVISPTTDYPAAKRALKTMADEISDCVMFFLTSEKCQWQRDNQGVLLHVALSAKTVTLFRQSGATKPSQYKQGKVI